MTILLAILGRIWPYLLGLFAVLAAYGWAHHQGVVAERVNTVKAQQETKAARAELEAYKAKQAAYAAQLVLDWQSARDRADAAEKERDDARTKLFTSLAQAARSVPDRATVLSGTFRGVLNSAAAAASAGTTPTAASPGEDSASTTAGAVLDWGIDTAEKYRACTEQVTGLQSFYNELRAAQTQQ